MRRSVSKSYDDLIGWFGPSFTNICWICWANANQSIWRSQVRISLLTRTNMGFTWNHVCFGQPLSFQSLGISSCEVHVNQPLFLVMVQICIPSIRTVIQIYFFFLQVLYLGGSVYKLQSFLKGHQLFLCTKAEISEKRLALLQTIMVKDISLSYFSIFFCCFSLSGFCPPLPRVAPRRHQGFQRGHPGVSGPGGPGARWLPSWQDDGIYTVLRFHLTHPSSRLVIYG